MLADPVLLLGSSKTNPDEIRGQAIQFINHRLLRRAFESPIGATPAVKRADEFERRILAQKDLAQLLSVFRSYDVILIDTPLPSRGGRYLAGIDSVLICMKSDGALKGRAASAVAAVKALGASSVAIAATMAEPASGTLRETRPIPAEATARAV